MKPHFGCRVVDVEITEKSGEYTAKKMVYIENGQQKTVEVGEKDLCFIQNGSMTDSATVGTWKTPARLAESKEAPSFALWEKIVAQHPGKFGNPKPFYKNVNEAMWQSFTVTMKNQELFEKFTKF